MHIHILMQWGIDESTLNILLVHTLRMQSSSGKKHAYSGMFHDRCKIIRIAGNMLTLLGMLETGIILVLLYTDYTISFLRSCNVSERMFAA